MVLCYQSGPVELVLLDGMATVTSNEQLTELFSGLEDAKREARVSFTDGGVYDLRIVSTWHAEAGGHHCGGRS